ncbi:hypothetical protein D3C72_1418180 [compost metagenome]
MMYSRIFHFWEGFNSTRLSGLFHLYDKEALHLIDEIHKYWGESLSFGHCYRDSGDQNHYLFGTPSSLPKPKNEDEEFEKILEAIKNLKLCTLTLFQYIRDNYIEVDLNETSKNANKEFIAFHEEIADSART